MNWFRNWSIGFKLGGGFALILGLFLVLAVVFVKAIQVPKVVAQALLENQRMYIEVLHIDIALKEYQLGGDQVALKKIDAARESCRVLSAALIKKVNLQSTKDLIAWGDRNIGPLAEKAKGVALTGGAASRVWVSRHRAAQSACNPGGTVPCRPRQYMRIMSSAVRASRLRRALFMPGARACRLL